MPGNYQITAVAAPCKGKKNREHGAQLTITVRDGKAEGKFDNDNFDFLHWANAYDTMRAISTGYEEYGLLNLQRLFKDIEKRDIADARAD